MIMSIIGPREMHDYRNYNLLVRGINSFQRKPQKSLKLKPRYVPVGSASTVRATLICLWRRRHADAPMDTHKERRARRPGEYAREHIEYRYIKAGKQRVGMAEGPPKK